MSCSKELFPSFDHEPFDIQDRQYVHLSEALFEEYARAARSLEGSVWKKHFLLLENLKERQVGKSTLMKERIDIISARHCSEKRAVKLPKIEDYG